LGDTIYRLRSRSCSGQKLFRSVLDDATNYVGRGDRTEELADITPLIGEEKRVEHDFRRGVRKQQKGHLEIVPIGVREALRKHRRPRFYN